MSEGWGLVLLVISAALMIWLIVRTVKGNPQAFSKANLSKSIYTIGILALVLILIIFFCVMLLRNT
jgi:hypothetical protein